MGFFIFNRGSGLEVPSLAKEAFRSFMFIFFPKEDPVLPGYCFFLLRPGTGYPIGKFLTQVLFLPIFVLYQ